MDIAATQRFGKVKYIFKPSKTFYSLVFLPAASALAFKPVWFCIVILLLSKDQQSMACTRFYRYFQQENRAIAICIGELRPQ